MPQKYVRTIWEKLSEKSCEFIDGYDECTSEKFDLDDICQVGFKQVSGDNTQLVQYYIAYMNTVFVVPFFYSCEGTISKNGMTLFDFIKILPFPDSIECIFKKEIKIFSGFITQDTITVYTVEHIDFWNFILDRSAEEDANGKLGLLSEEEQAELDRYVSKRKTNDIGDTLHG